MAQRYAQCANCIEQGQARDAEIFPLVNIASESRLDTWKPVIWRCPIKLPRGSFAFFGAVAAFKQPHCTNEADQ